MVKSGVNINQVKAIMSVSYKNISRWLKEGFKRKKGCGRKT